MCTCRFIFTGRSIGIGKFALVGHPKIPARMRPSSPAVSDKPCAVAAGSIVRIKISPWKIVIPTDNAYCMSSSRSVWIIERCATIIIGVIKIFACHIVAHCNSTVVNDHGLNGTYIGSNICNSDIFKMICVFAESVRIIKPSAPIVHSGLNSCCISVFCLRILLNHTDPTCYQMHSI